ncbi:MAG: hypothetical protein LBI42_00530 [Chitinispirillales bacterium]|nr:hypothetical protein [Chitinispirillales bacterium]
MSKIFYMPANDISGTWTNSGEQAGTPEFKEDVSIFKFIQDNETTAVTPYAITPHRIVLS